MRIALDEVVHFDVVTHNPSTAAVSDADSTPTFDVYEEATDTGLLGATNFTKRTSLTGNYRGTFTASAANGFEAGKWYSVVASATVNAVAAKSVPLRFTIVPAESSAGVPKVDLSHWLGTAAATPTVAGVPEVDVTHFNGTAGTFASGRPEVNTSHIAGSAVSTTSAQIGVNVVQMSTSAPAADNLETAALAYSATRGLAGTALPAAAADAAGGLPISDAGGLDLDAQIGTDIDAILADTGTDGVVVAAGSKTGYALSAAGVQAIWDALTAALTTVGSIGKKLADWTIHSAADVWSSATRTLTAATNITSTGGTTVPQTGDSYARLGAPAGTSVSADIAAIEAQTDDIGAAGAGLTAIPWNAAWDAEVESEATDALNAYDPPTRTEATADKDEILTQLPAAPVKNAQFTYVIKMVASSDHVTPKTGLTVTMTRSLDGAAFGAATGTVTEISTGHYKVVASAADMNGDNAAHRFTGTDADDLTVVWKTVS